MLKSVIDKIRISDIVKKLLKGSFWVLGGTVFSKVLVFCATVLVARILSKELYGELGIIRSTIHMFIAISSFGIGSTATKYIAQHRKSHPDEAIKIYWIANIFVFLMGVLATLVLLVFAPYIATRMLNAPFLSNDLRVAAVILFFSLMNGAQTGALSGFEDFRRMAFSNVLNGVSEILLLPLGAYFLGLTGAVLAFGTCFLIVLSYNTFFVNRHLCKLNRNFYSVLLTLKKSDFKVIYRFSFPVALSSWICMIVYWCAKTMLIKDDGFSSMANYDVAEQFKAQLLFIPGILSQVLLPIITSNASVGKTNSAHSAARFNILLNICITGIIFLMVLLFGKYLLMLYGKQYTNLIPLFVLCFTAIFESVSNSYVPIILSADKVWNVLVFNLIWGTVLILVYRVASDFMVAENALSLSYLIAALVHCANMTIYVKKKSLI